MFYPLYLQYCKIKYIQGNVELNRKTHLLLYKNSRIISNGNLKIGIDYSKYGGSGIDPRKDNCRIHLKNSTLYTIGNVSIKPSVKIIGYNCDIEIDDGTQINYGTEIICSKRITIGKNCRIAPNVVIRDSDAHKHSYGKEKPKTSIKTIHIKDNVWLGQQSMILKGVTIGKGSVVAPKSVVTKDVEPHTLVGGIPAKKLRDNIKWEI